MNIHPLSLAHLSNQELLTRVRELAREEFQATSSLVAHLGELDERELYLGEGYPSLFSYCTQALHLSEHAAYNRIQAARSARKFPVILENLAEGSVNLTTIKLLAPHLTPENHLELLEAARHRSKLDVEELMACVRPLPALPSSIRKLPERGGNGGAADDSTLGLEPAAASLPMAETVPGQETRGVAATTSVGSDPSRKPVVSLLAPELYKVQFTAGAETYQKLRQAQELLRHQVPNGDPAVVVDLALSALLEKLTRRKFAAVRKPRTKTGGERDAGDRQPAKKRRKARETDASLSPEDASPSPSDSFRNESLTKAAIPPRQLPTESRHIPAEVKREVWSRDHGRCAFVSKAGRRCAERGKLEFHHVEPYILGGKATIQNIELRCRPHNAYEGELYFGRQPEAILRE